MINDTSTVKNILNSLIFTINSLKKWKISNTSMLLKLTAIKYVTFQIILFSTANPLYSAFLDFINTNFDKWVLASLWKQEKIDCKFGEWRRKFAVYYL